MGRLIDNLDMTKAVVWDVKPQTKQILYRQKKIVFLSLKIVFVLASSVDPYEMLH